MKKIKVIQVIGFVLFALYVGLFAIDLIWGVLGETNGIIFSCILAIISLSLLYKGFLLRSSSTMWFAMTLILSAILLITFDLFFVDTQKFYFVLAFVPIVASIFNLLIFKYIIYIKVIILNISIIIPILVARFWTTEWWIVALIGLASITIGILICRYMNLGKEKV